MIRGIQSTMTYAFRYTVMLFSQTSGKVGKRLMCDNFNLGFDGNALEEECMVRAKERMLSYNKYGSLKENYNVRVGTTMVHCLIRNDKYPYIMYGVVDKTTCDHTDGIPEFAYDVVTDAVEGQRLISSIQHRNKVVRISTNDPYLNRYATQLDEMYGVVLYINSGMEILLRFVPPSAPSATVVFNPCDKYGHKNYNQIGWTLVEGVRESIYVRLATEQEIDNVFQRLFNGEWVVEYSNYIVLNELKRVFLSERYSNYFPTMRHNEEYELLLADQLSKYRPVVNN